MTKKRAASPAKYLCLFLFFTFLLWAFPDFFISTKHSKKTIFRGVIILLSVAYFIEAGLSILVRRILKNGSYCRIDTYPLLPLKLVALLSLQTIFDMPISAFLWVSIWLLLVDSALLLLPAAHTGRTAPEKFGTKPVLITGILLYTVMAAPAVLIFVKHHGYQPLTSVMVVALPLIILCSTYLPGGGREGFSFILAVSQGAVYPFLPSCSDNSFFPVFLLLLFFPWAFLIVSGRIAGGKSNPTAFRVTFPLIFLFCLGSLETFLRTNDFTDNYFSQRSVLRAHILSGEHSDLAVHVDWQWVYFLNNYTNIFDQFSPGDSVEVGISMGIPGSRKTYGKRKDDGVYRIICLGSSSTYGMGATTPDSTYPALLDRILNDGSDTKIEVINGGVPGIAFTPCVIYLEEVLFLLDPDLVIVYFGFNSDSPRLGEIWTDLSARIPADFSGEDVSGLLFHLKYRLKNPHIQAAVKSLMSFHTFNMLQKVLDYPAAILRQTAPAPNTSPDDPGPISEIPLRLIDFCLERGVKLLLIPELSYSAVMENTDPHRYFGIFSSVTEESASREVRCLDLRETFRRHLYSLPADGREEFFPGAMHMHNEGYALLAKTIAEYLFEAFDLPTQKDVSRIRPSQGSSSIPLSSIGS